jgi:hypothetical protein
VRVGVGVEVWVGVWVGAWVGAWVRVGFGVEVGMGVEVKAEVAVGVGVAVAGKVAVRVGVAVIVGVRVAVGVGVAVAVGVASRSTTPGGTKRNWSTVAMTTARGKMMIFRYSPNSAGMEVRKFFSLAQSSLEDTATKEICQVRRPSSPSPIQR